MPDPSNPLGIPDAQPTSSSTSPLSVVTLTTLPHSDENALPSVPTTSYSEANFNELPLDELLDLSPEFMTNDQLAAYVQRCSVLRSSAQTRKAALNADAVKLGVTKTKAKKTPKDSVGQALALLAQLQAQKAQ